MKTILHHCENRLTRFSFLTILLLTGITLQGFSQSQAKSDLLKMIDEDRTTIEVIASADKNIHADLLLVAQTPDLLGTIEELQQKSQTQFKLIIDPYDRTAQTALYEMARYPDLIAEIVSKGKPSQSLIENIVLKYPQDIQETARKNGLKNFDALVRIEHINVQVDKAFTELLDPYSKKVHESVRVLLNHPEVVSALVNDKSFTKLLGEVYREDPEWVINQINQTAVAISTREKEDLNSYKEQLEKDPTAYNELVNASDKFAKENNEVRSIQNSSAPVVETRIINCYPYWFGYPYWYSEPFWRPRPLYFHTGIYRNTVGIITFYGLPSALFLQWHTTYHPRLYRHLSYNYYNFYQSHYMSRFQVSPRLFPRQGFYRSIENHIINNRQVNNRALQRIDHQRGLNIVRAPSAYKPTGQSSRATVNGRRNFSTQPIQGLNNNSTTAPRRLDRPSNSVGSSYQKSATPQSYRRSAVTAPSQVSPPRNSQTLKSTNTAPSTNTKSTNRRQSTSKDKTTKGELKKENSKGRER
jgi:hypothetical protein